ncbi:hypothetical protein [Methylobacterium sp. WL9]|uniref:hypothetical protein n=1 Tax=Methylobacterium sp. WL9 TaxID=2603898 RepID=UPI0011CBE897|nr:hypothetical protein [Methylobacterium sp. WL9]TXN21277.1 hypothetical protein FV217_14875 [Methylobacterium sp. WL9]
MRKPTFEFRTTILPDGAATLSWFVQPGYIVLDLSPEDLDDPDERQFMVVAEEQVGSKLRGAILALGIEGYGFVPSIRSVTYEDAELTTIEVDGPSAYVAKVVAATQQLGLKNLRA